MQKRSVDEGCSSCSSFQWPVDGARATAAAAVYCHQTAAAYYILSHTPKDTKK